jgi:enoyl-CoA hydratase/carnithine racemase
MDGASVEPLLLRADAGGVARLTLNRPAARNSLSRGMLAALATEFARIAGEDAVRVVVLAAAGPVFCAGHDLREITAHRADADGGLAFFTEAMAACAAVMQAIVALPQPVIAEVQGVATAAGCQLVATCDLAIAADSATFATPGVNIGLFCSTPMVALSRNISRKRAMEMLLLGEALHAAEAAEFGLINRAVPRDVVMATALEMASKIASKSTATVSLGKQTFYAQAEMELGSAYATAADVMVANMMYADAAEGIGAFIEKRHPTWSGC